MATGEWLRSKILPGPGGHTAHVTALSVLVLCLQILRGQNTRPPWYTVTHCGFPPGAEGGSGNVFPAEWVGSAYGRVRVVREDSYVYLGYEFRCERREENVTVARAKTGGINDLIMCFKLVELTEDLVVMRLYTQEVLKSLKSGALTTVQYMCDRYKLDRRTAKTHWSRPNIPAWDFLIFVRQGTRPARSCPPMLHTLWRMDTTFRRDPCLTWQYVVDGEYSTNRLSFIHNSKHPDVLDTRGRRDFTCLYSVKGEDDITYVVLLNDDNRDDNFTCLAYTPDMMGRPYGALMRVSPLEGSTCGMFPSIESLDTRGLPVTLQHNCPDALQPPIVSLTPPVLAAVASTTNHHPIPVYALVTWSLLLSTMGYLLPVREWCQ